MQNSPRDSVRKEVSPMTPADFFMNLLLNLLLNLLTAYWR